MPYEDRNKNAVPFAGKRPHVISMEDRKKLSVSGVLDVESFDEHEIIMDTTGGCLVVRGDELSIGRLNVDNGDVDVQGRITDLCYEEAAPHQSLWARLFR